MKKLIYCALALAAGLFATSCQQENLEPVAQEGTVTFTVELPGVATKAIGNGSNVNELIYEVWKTGETGEIDANSTRLYQKTLTPLAEGVARKWIVSLNLVQDQTYKVLFWAQVAKPENHENYDTDNLTAVTYAAKIAKDYSANQEDYAAFYGTKVLNTRIPLKGETITLTRPFAQLNIATDNDVEEYTVTMKTSKVTVAGVPTFFNVATSEATVPETITFDTFAVPTEDLEVASRTEPYDYVAMNYVFASKTGIVAKVSYDINSTLTAKNLDGSNGATTDVTISNVIPNVPLQENFRTNIIGNLLSSTTQYEIEIDARFQSNGNDDMEAINDGLVENINGDYEISTAAGFAYAINNLFADGGTFYIHPGKYDFTGLTVVPQPTNPGVILNVKANEVPVVTRSTTPEFEIIGLNVPLVAKVSKNSQALFSGIVLPEDTKLVGVNNGVVAISDCSNEQTETPAELIGEGDGKVVNTSSITSVAEINAAIAEGLTVIELTADITGLTEIFTISKPVTIDGCGHKLTSTAGRAINVDGEDANGVTIKNLVINCSGERAINIIQNATNVTIDNVTATAANYTVNVAKSAPGAKVNIENSTLNGLCTVNVASPGAKVTINNSTINCNDNNTTAGEAYSALCLNKAAVGAEIIATNTVVNVTEGSDSSKGRNGAEDGTVTINGSIEDVTVTVAVITYPNSDSYYGFETVASAIEFAKETDVISLIRNISVEETIVVNDDKTVTIDLNGKTLTGTMPRGIAIVENNGTLTIQNGTISSTAENGGSAISNNGTLTITDAIVNGAPSNTSTGTASYAVNSQGAGSKLVVNNSRINGRGVIGATEGTKVEINGGTYHTPAVAWGHAVYADGEGTEVVINDGTFSEGYENSANNWGMYQIYSGDKAKVTVNGGDFSQPWDCANGYDLHTATEGTIEIYGGTFAENPSSQNGKNYVANGYKAVEKGGIYTVIPANYTLVSTADELVAALGANQNVLFANNITVAATKGGYSKAGILQNKAQTIDGNGYTLTVTGAGATWDCAIYTNGGTIKNLTVAGPMRGIFTAGLSTDLYIDNVEFKDVIYTFNSDGKEMPDNPFGVYVSNSIVNGWTSHSDIHTEVVYTNCSFGEGSGYKFCRPYGKTSFVECTFCSGYTVDESQTNDITYTNCVFN